MLNFGMEVSHVGLVEGKGSMEQDQPLAQEMIIKALFHSCC